MTVEYRLLTFRDEHANPIAGVLVDGRIYPAANLLQHLRSVESNTVMGLLKSWPTVQEELRESVAAVRFEDGRALTETILEAPLLYPGAVFATGGNYTDHLQEMARLASRPLDKFRVDEPFFTLKTTVHSIIGDGAAIRYPRFSRKLDYEAEIGVVIGRPADNIDESQAMDAVAGYLLINDLSARDYVRREGLPNQVIHDWFGQKSFRDSMPMGPWLTPAEFVPDPRDLSIRLWVNDVLKQDGNSKNMIYSIAELIACLSKHLVLQPGDVISTGCPAGTGVGRGEFLKPGDEIRMEVSHCGVLTNTVTEG